VQRSFRRATALAAVALAVACAPPPAGAAPSAAASAVTGSGTASPGLGTTPQPQNFTGSCSITGVFVAGTKPVPGTTGCSFTGSGSASVAEGVFSGTLVATGPATLNATINVAFVGTLAVLSGTATICSGVCGDPTPFVGVFVLVPTSVNPTTSFSFAGAI